MNILVIAPEPNSGAIYEGFMQRVLAIDGVLRQCGNVQYLNLCRGWGRGAHQLRQADVVYAHSIFMAQKVLAHYPDIGPRTVLDLHGAAPEEQVLAGNHSRARELQTIEDLAFEHGSSFVAVSSSMVEHFQAKFPASLEADWTTLPIFQIGEAPTSGDRDWDKVVYVGGAQKWQKVWETLGAISDAPANYHFEILTPDIGAFSTAHETGKKVAVRTVPNAEVQPVLARAGLGFILRDDHIVNRVACPTKLIEYMANGVVPIVLSPRIGDMGRLGYRYVRIEDFVKEPIDKQWLRDASGHNLKITDELRRQTAVGLANVVEACRACAERTSASAYSANRARVNAFRQVFIDNKFRLTSWVRRLGIPGRRS